MTDGDEVGKGKKSRLRLVLAGLALLCSLIVPSLMLAGVGAHFGQVSDLAEYYVAAKMVVEGKAAEIYKIAPFFAEQRSTFPSLGDRGIVLYIPPFSFLFLMPLAIIPAELANVVWLTVLSLCTVLSTFVLAKTFKLTLEQSLWLGTGVAVAAPVYEGLRIGQIAPILLLSYALGLYFLRKGKDVPAALCLSVLAMKPQELLPIFVFLLFSKRTGVWLAMISVLLVLMVISLLLPSAMEMYSSYFSLLQWSSIHTEYMQPQLSATVRGQILRVPGIEPPIANIFSYVALGLSLLSIAIAGWRSRTDRELNWRALMLIAVPLGLITALHCHDYDLVLIIPSIVALMIGLANVRPSIVGAMLLMLMPFVVPFYVEMHFNYLLKSADLINPAFVVFAMQVVILVASGWKLLLSGRAKEAISAAESDLG